MFVLDVVVAPFRSSLGSIHSIVLQRTATLLSYGPEVPLDGEVQFVPASLNLFHGVAFSDDVVEPELLLPVGLLSGCSGPQVWCTGFVRWWWGGRRALPLAVLVLPGAMFVAAVLGWGRSC